MSTKSNRSSGTQINSRGVTQGNTLVGPRSGLPIDEVVDQNGVRRIAVDAALTLDTVEVQIEDLKPDKDQVGIGDPETGYTLEILPDGSINTNVQIDAADGDNIAISDGTNTLKINPDGSINANVVTSAPGIVKSFYNEITSLASGILTTITTYIAPVGKTTYLQKIEFSGSNIAEYTIEINNVIVAKKRTYFGGQLNTDTKYVEGGNGFPLSVGDVVTARVIHSRPMMGDFDSRIQVIEV